MKFLKKLFGKTETHILSNDVMNAISDHFIHHFGEVETVFEEMVSDTVHIDVYVIPEVPGKDYGILFTVGMSALPMPGADWDDAYAELFIVLPKEWASNPAMLSDENLIWPMSLLKTMARLPTSNEVAIYPGVSMPNGDPHEPFPGTKIVGGMLGKDVYLPSLTLGGNTIKFYPVIPLMEPEMDWKIYQSSPTALVDRYEDMGLDPYKAAIVDIDREPYFM